MSITKKRALEIANSLENSVHLLNRDDLIRCGIELRVYLNKEPKRKIVQLIQDGEHTLALANDGTTWKLSITEVGRWKPFTSQLPQPE